MSGRRFFEIFRQETIRTVKSPAFIIFLVVLVFVSYGLTSGNVRISSGSADVGGTKAFKTSEFSNAFIISLLSFILYSFFVSIPAGMTLIRDRECKVEEIIHTTTLKPSEYILGKFLAVLTVFIGALLFQCSLFMAIHYLLPNAADAELIGPFCLTNYLRPFVYFCLPTIVFFTGMAFFIGEWTRKPAMVYLFPTLYLIVDIFFFVNWSPEWLPQFWNNLLILIEPAGFRWLDETWLQVDKGAAFYNTQPVKYNILFLLNRLIALAMGLIPMVFAYRHFVSKLRRKDNGKLTTSRPVSQLEPTIAASSLPIGAQRRQPGFIHSLINVLRSEFQELRNHAGLYLFIPIFTLFILGDVFTAIGLFDTPLLVTSGSIAVKTLPPLTILGILFLMFFVVESFMREDTTGIAAILYSSPVSNYAILTGKMLAILLVGGLIMLASFLSAMLGLLIQGSVPVDPIPFFLVWGLVLIPTYFVWIAFISFIFSLVRNRYITYAIGLGLFMTFGVLQMEGKINWVSNWIMWRSLNWSDISILEIDRSAILLNRLLYLAVAVLFIVLANICSQRVRRDAARTIHRLQPGSLFRGSYRVLPFILMPIIIGWCLFSDVRSGHQGSVYEKAAKDYWKQNIRTFLDYPEPGLEHVELAVTIEPDSGSLHTTGYYHLINHHETVLHKVVFTGDYGWENVTWTINGNPAEPENRSGLYVFTQNPPLEPGQQLTIGFEFDNTVPKGISKNGGGTSEFILPSGVVLTSFSPSFCPLPGFVESVGVTKDNRANSKEFEPDFYVGRTEPFVGAANAFTTHIEVTVPAAMRANAVGVLTDVRDGDSTKTWVWESDYPIRFFNIVAGVFERWDGDGTAIYYNEQHPYNVERIGQALNGARKYYSQWYAPYPWKELRITEFPGIAYYAQGFPSNISFSEQVGFLVKEEADDGGNAAFSVAAHEAAHQWWANMLTPGEGPGGNVLSEGMAHFSTAMLIDTVLGETARVTFMKRIEHSYGEQRSVDNERSLAWVDGTRPGDSTVQYDKGGWVIWMLKERMGQEAFLEGIQAFIEEYRFGPDYPVIQDFTAFMRDYALDVDAYDAFVDQWFYDVVIPEYQLSDVTCVESDDTGQKTWVVTGRLTNTGTGCMAVDVAAVTESTETTESVPEQTSRSVVSPGAGKTVSFTIRCGFKPYRIIIDPDFSVLQLNRGEGQVIESI